jgi:PIN domain
MPRPIVVFDTNVLFSAVGWSGTPRRCLDLGRNGTIQAVTCDPIMEELADKLKRKLAFSDKQVLETAAYLFGLHAHCYSSRGSERCLLRPQGRHGAGMRRRCRRNAHPQRRQETSAPYGSVSGHLDSLTSRITADASNQASPIESPS